MAVAPAVKPVRSKEMPEEEAAEADKSVPLKTIVSVVEEVLWIPAITNEPSARPLALVCVAAEERDVDTAKPGSGKVMTSRELEAGMTACCCILMVTTKSTTAPATTVEQVGSKVTTRFAG